jgi:hypothetical protein
LSGTVSTLLVFRLLSFASSSCLSCIFLCTFGW